MLFPRLTHHNSRLYLLINSLQSLWFVEAVWYFFFANFVSYFEIGIIFGLSTLLGIIAQIPTGVFADRYGRKRAVVIGCLIMSTGWFLMATLGGFWQFLLGSIASSIGRAFVTGALEAITYDSLPAKTKDHDYEYLVTLTSQFTTVLFAVTVIMGGILYNIYFRLPHLAYAVANIISFFAALLLLEPKKHGSASIINRQANIFSHNLVGFQELSRVSLRPFLLPAISSLAFFFLYDWGFSKPSMALNFGYHVEGQAVIYAGMSLVSLMGLRLFPRLRNKLGDERGIIFLNVLMGIGFLLGSLKLGYPGVIALLFIELAGNLNRPWISLILNARVSSTFRATTLSTLEFISKFPYIFTNLLLGSYLDSGRANSFHLWVGVFILTLALTRFMIGKSRKGNRALAKKE